VEKQFDINVEWFDQRTANKCMSDFYGHANMDVTARKEAMTPATE